MLPNFLIAGAPKCGTTSLFHYLNQHPQIFFPQLKEPHYFSQQYKKLPFLGPGDDQLGSNIHMNMSWDKYMALFDNASPDQRIGEASADYLYYHNCATEIRQLLGDIEIIIILRNPVARAISAYTHMRRILAENLGFEEALKYEQDRIADNWDFMWHYKSVGFYFNQLKSYYSHFSKIHVIKYDNFADDTDSVLKFVCQFLNINESFKFDSRTRHNISGVPKSKAVQLLINKPTLLSKSISIILPKSFRKNISARISKYNLNKPEYDRDIKNSLLQLFKDDISRTQDLTGVDLSNWLESY